MNILGWLRQAWTSIADPRRSVTFPVACHMVTVATGGGRPTRVSVAPEDMSLPHSRDALGDKIEGTQAEAAAFVVFCLGQPAFDEMVRIESFGAIALMFRMWRAMHGRTDSGGRLVRPVQCCAVTPDLRPCPKVTSDPSGFCNAHSNPGQKSIWNTVWTYESAAESPDPEAT